MSGKVQPSQVPRREEPAILGSSMHVYRTGMVTPLRKSYLSCPPNTEPPLACLRSNLPFPLRPPPQPCWIQCVDQIKQNSWKARCKQEKDSSVYETSYRSEKVTASFQFFFFHHLNFCLTPFEWPGYRRLGRGRSQWCLELAQSGVFGGEWGARRSSTEQGENRCRVFRMSLGLCFHSRNPAIHATPAVGSRAASQSSTILGSWSELLIGFWLEVISELPQQRTGTSVT